MADKAAVEEKLASKYRQPKGVEQFGIEPVPEDLTATSIRVDPGVSLWE